MRDCSENYVEVNGTRICWFEWGEPNDEPTIFLVHATGFHARCWDQTIAHLGNRHVIAMDMRGHGRSGKEGPITWDTFGQDVAAVVRALDLNQLVAAGHSMGGHCLVHAMADESSRFDRAVLIDPVIMSPDIYSSGESVQAAFLNEAGEHPVARRRNLFDDAEAMFQNFQGRGSYGLWQEAVLHDYCQYGLLPNPEGPGCILACPPKIEAAIYLGSASNNIFESVRSIQIPVTVLRAKQREGDRTEMDFSASPTWPELAGEFPNGRDVYLPELTHFIPMQAPELAAEYILGQR